MLRGAVVLLVLVLLPGGDALTAQGQCPNIEVGVCFRPAHGNSVNTTAIKKTSAESAADCCGACLATASCASWTMVGEGGENCHLKPGVPANTERQHQPACTSGIARDNPAPLPPQPPPTPPAPPTPPGALSVLFVVIDDLRPEFNVAYGQTKLVTPHIDKFAASALTFTRAYVQYSHCSPSRNSFMTGRSPQSTGVYNFIDSFREEGFGMEWTTMPQFFKQHGWWTAGGGKVYHPGHPPNNDMPYSWDVYFKANGDDHGCRDNETLGWCCGLSGSNVCPSDEPDSAFYDWVLANDTISQLAQHAQRRTDDDMRGTSQPFFIAAGLRRPHRVWHVPRRFYDLYANNGTHPTKMPLALHKTGPEGMPELAFIDNAWPNFGYNQSVPIDDWRAELGRWGYYASVSFTDSNVGMMLDALDRLALDDETVVLFTGDHGWELGEHGEWCKRTNFEIGLRVPLMIRAPNHPSSMGKATPDFAESLDFYRTLIGLTSPALLVDIEATVEGVDLTPIFAAFDNAASPVADLATLPNNVSFSQMARCPCGKSFPCTTPGIESACNTVPRNSTPFMGYSIRVDSYRYNAWIEFDGTKNRGQWARAEKPGGGTEYEELYSHKGDDGTNWADGFENENIATAQPTVVAALWTELRGHFDTPPGQKPLQRTAVDQTVLAALV